MSAEHSNQVDLCPFHCAGCLCRKTSTEHERSSLTRSWGRRPKSERIRISEDVYWRDQALNDFTGNLSGIVGIKKQLHAPVKRTFRTTRAEVHRRKRINKNFVRTQAKESSGGLRPSSSRPNSLENGTEDGATDKVVDTPFSVIDDVRVTERLPATDESKEKNCRSTDFGEFKNSFPADDKLDVNLQERIRHPTVFEIRQEMQQRPTEELDLSSSEDDTLLESVHPSDAIEDPLLTETKPTYQRRHYNRLYSDENIRPDKKSQPLEEKFNKLKKHVQKKGKFWDTRGETLLGYDFVAGSDDNRKFLGRSSCNYNELKDFREVYRDECKAQDEEHSERRCQTKSNADHFFDGMDDHCIHAYRINERLFFEPENVDEKRRSVCSICLLLRDYAFDGPTHASVSVPSKIRQRPMQKSSKISYTSKINSLALLQNCESEIFKR